MSRHIEHDPTERAVGRKNIASREHPFLLESGRQLNEIGVAYETHGQLNRQRDNAVLICHALTGNSHAAGIDRNGRPGWWNGLIGPGLGIDTSRHFVICANVLGGCYGTTGPLSIDPKTGKQYGQDFPPITIRDIVRAQRRLVAELGVNRLAAVVGGSMGGMQAYEWGASWPEDVGHLIAIAAGPVQSPWRRGLNGVVREGLQLGRAAGSADDGLRLARKIAMLTYRGHREFFERFSGGDRRVGRSGSDERSVERYLARQARKLTERFDLHTYEALLAAMDSHDIARGRGDIERVLRSLRPRTLLVGISSDILYPADEVRSPASLIPDCTYREIESDCGHDAFLIETEQLGRFIGEFLGKGSDHPRTARRLPAVAPSTKTLGHN